MCSPHYKAGSRVVGMENIQSLWSDYFVTPPHQPYYNRIGMEV
jgi:hypothetical protein